MHDIKWIRENPDAFKAALNRRGLDAEAILAEAQKLDGERRANIGPVSYTHLTLPTNREV